VSASDNAISSADEDAKFRITPWLKNLEYQNCLISAAFIGMAASAVFLTMIKWGKKLRIQSASGYWALARKAETCE
jgi:hypothetical protein